MKKLQILPCKLLGICVILAYLCFVHYSYFELPKYGDLPFVIFVLIYSGAYLVLPYVLDKIVLSVGLLFYGLYTVVQVCYCKLFDQYLFFNTAVNLFSEAADYSSDALDLISGKEILILVCAVISIVLLCLIRMKKSEKQWMYYLVSVVCGILCVCGAFVLGNQQKQMIVDLGNDVFMYNQTDRYLYDKMTSKKNFVECFGLESFLYRDIKDHYFVDESEKEEENARVFEFLAENLPYKENEMTGLLEGKHLLLVEAESLNMAAIDEVLTPTLYKLVYEGWYFKNFYSPTLTGSTSDVETMVNLSLIPVNNGLIVSQSYAENEYPTTLAKGFASKGYVTNAYHNNYKVFYNRGNYFETLGYDTFLDSSGLGLENGSSDKIVGEVISWIPVFNELDFSFWVTYSGHQPYLMESLSDTSQYPVVVQEEYQPYIELVQNTYPDLDEKVQLYLAKNISLDKALETYIQTYEWMDQLDQLVIVMYGDHCVKMYDEKAEQQTIEILGRSLDDTPLTLWYPGIEPKVIEKYCTDIDLLPTLFNLYNIDYNKQTILGNDIFDERYHGFQFTTNWTITTDDYVYDTKNGTYSSLEISEEMANTSLNRYLQYQEISNIIYENNTFQTEE